jgi:hypothetical protein
MINGRWDEEYVAPFQDLLFAGDVHLEYATFYIGTLGMHVLVDSTYAAFFEVHFHNHQALIIGHDFAFAKVIEDFPFDVSVFDPVRTTHVQK